LPIAPRARRPIAAALLGAAWSLFWAVPARAIPPLHPRQQYEALIADGQLEAGREGFRRETARLLDDLQKAAGEGSIQGLGKRALLVNGLALTIQAWATGEAKAVQTKKAPSPEGAQNVLRDELLPLAQRIRDLRVGHEQEASRLEPGLPESERQGAAWAFDAVRLSDEVRARVPMSLARLARIAGSAADVQRVFDAFGGRIGRFGSASEYLATPEDYDRALGLREEVPPAAARTQAVTADTETAIRSTLSTYYQALTRRQPRRLRECLARNAPQARSVKRGLRTRRVVAVGEVGRLSLEPQPDGSVRARVDDIPVTLRTDSGTVVRQGSQTFTLVLEDGQWKILEVGQ
jgi:hypothetical protein